MATPKTIIDNNNGNRPSIEDGDLYLDYLAAVQAEREEILNIFYESERLNPTPPEPLLTDSEILALFDSGYDVDMIIKAYPEFELKHIKSLKRRWSDKQHKNRKKKKKKKKNNFDNNHHLLTTNDEQKSNVTNNNNDDSNTNNNTNNRITANSPNSANSTPAHQTSTKRKRRRRSKQKNNHQQNGGNHICDWCFQHFDTEKALKSHFKHNPHMHAAI